MQMLSLIKSLTNRSDLALAQDLAGATALMVMLVVGLHLPSVI